MVIVVAVAIVAVPVVSPAVEGSSSSRAVVKIQLSSRSNGGSFQVNSSNSSIIFAFIEGKAIWLGVLDG